MRQWGPTSIYLTAEKASRLVAMRVLEVKI